MKIFSTFFSLLFCLLIGCVANKKIAKYPQGTGIEVNQDGIIGYLFDNKMTIPWMSSQKELNFKSYWWVDKCVVTEIEMCLEDYLINNFDNTVSENRHRYIRQYFPFISKNGHQTINVTMTLITNSEESLEEMKERLSKNYSSVFDGEQDSYFSILLDFSAYMERKKTLR